MSLPLSAAKFLDALRREGVMVRQHGHWRTHNRDHMGPFCDVRGIMLHHTAGRDSLELVIKGYMQLPGPLCIGLIAKDGTVHLVGYGRTNHAGRGSLPVLNDVTADRRIPLSPGRDQVDGNSFFYGFEIENLGDGRDLYPRAQLAAVERTAAAICRAHDWHATSVIGHKEWTSRKIDPSFSMPAMRKRIAGRLATAAADSDTTTRSTASASRYEPFPGAAFFRTGTNSPIITAMGERLVAVGCGRYTVGPGPRWGEADRASYACWQREQGRTRQAAHGYPDRRTWDQLKVPRQT
ncbi:peptidoglycan-binding protein [Streptomyces sp. NPDC007205]|uniref:peptidoglycan-binding protein n=1 Tax=Streptomyces sp. NPDC007205 TaxID=3154316 RepID=UPI00340BB7B4